MKNIITLFLVMLSTLSFSQTSNWTSVKETNINYGSSISFDLFTNKDGNHIIIQESNALKYYKMNLSGTAGTPENIETSPVVSPSITGNDNVIYIVYRKNSESEITAKVSTDGGSSWNYISRNPINSNATKIEAVMSNEKLHIAFEVPYGVIKHNYFYQGIWVNDFIVDNGNTPRISAWKDNDEDKIYIIYRADDFTGKWREYNVNNGQWSPLRFGYNALESGPAGFSVGTNYLYYYYYYATGGEKYLVNKTYNRVTGVYVREWAPLLNPTFQLHTTTTKNEKSHVAFWLNFNGIMREYNEGGAFDQIYYNPNQNPVSNPPINLSSSGNDVHVVWKDNLGLNNGNNLRYIYDDQPPLPPTGLTIIEDANHHPQLNWNVSPELDIYQYIVYRLDGYIGGGWQPLYQTGETTYTDESLSYCQAIPPATCESYRNVSYRVTVIDYGSNESNPSNTVTARLTGGDPQKIAINPDSKLPLEYSLAQNYPNPFNPLTTIDYSIKLSGMVTLKVYDMLGTEVASLVNYNKEVGNYSVTFNASELPSGIYFYTLTSGNFMATKKLILLK